MEIKKIFETVGYITKKETLATIEHDTANAMVLETREPYPGYHGTDIPAQLIPMSLFLMTDRKYSGEQMIRSTMKVKEFYFKRHFDAAPGMVFLFNTMSPCIRIKDMESYDNIHELIEAYRKAGIEFMKFREVEPYAGLIRVRKYFSLQVRDEGLYSDMDIPSMAYFEIPDQISWELFEEITYGLKPNVEFNNFDAALGVFFTPKKVLDVIRIFHPEIDMKDVEFLRNRYLEEIRRKL